MSPVVLALVDELGDIEKKLAPLKASIKRAEVLRSAIRAAYKDSPAGESFTITGARWCALLGPCGNESVINTARLQALAGAELFLACASVSVKALQEKCSAEIVGAVLSTRATGSRPLNLYGAPASAAKKGKRKK